MIRVSELLDLLASGELSNLALVDNYKIKDNRQEIVLRSINAGLTDLFTRFVLKKKKLETDPKLNKIAILTDDFVEILYLKQGEEILKPYEDYQLISVNEVILTNPRIMQIPITVEYQAKHRTLTQKDIDKDANIQLPLSYVNALVYFIASRLFTSIVNQLDGDVNESARYMQKYQAEIQMLTNQGIDVDSSYNHDWFNQRGFI
ncbi:hypothetical protein MOMA_06886 [Moraxella macacae 0408225]|uniref:Uncharacterized protein n=1 Tax=Moraxella macacae 0408225 TaxID=1230338 RepID=L2F5G4_9GAMM|nr:hypothetical protein [Moraxella macacae]ELA08267.1 hypothetical protein MOMA_06886 [Moraxella macacae 0408225]